MIYLTGFMGSGKSTVGRALAERLSLGFLDLDRRISDRAGAPIPEIFSNAGEEAFRFLEQKALREAAAEGESSVVATGGGLPVNELNRRLMKASGCVVHLRASFATVKQRIAGDKGRPLWKDGAERLFESRKKAYEDADLIVDTDDRTIDEIAQEIVDALPGLPSPTGVILPTNPYPVHVGHGMFRDVAGLLKRHLEPEGLFVLADGNVLKHHGTRIEEALASLPHFIMPVPPGEGSKSSAFLEKALSEMFGQHVNRQWACLAVGGGVTGDLAGYAAGIYMRGIPVIQAATTLLAQVDSSIGGKTGINNGFGKNLVGIFHQPLMVLSDITFLATLDKAQIRSAMAEVIKYGIIMNEPLFEYIEAGPPYDYARIVSMCCRDKALIVAGDEREGGLRRVLNFGHTLGHAVEKGSGYTVLHGEAVAVGMLFSAWLSRERGLLNGNDYARIRALIAVQGIIPAGLKLPPAEQAMEAMALDKKGSQTGIHFVLTPCIGDVTVQKLSEIEVLEAYRGFADGYARGL